MGKDQKNLEAIPEGPLLVVLDTTEFWNRLRMAGEEFDILKTFLVRHSSKLIVSDMVVQESIRHYRNQVKQALNELETNYATLKRLLPDISVHSLPTDIENLVLEYQSHLQTTLLGFRADQIGFDSVTITPLVDRSLKCKKPFDGEGKKGFRDAVMWESLLPVFAKHKLPVVIITGNTKDFGEHGKLADDLKGDLVRQGIDYLDVKVCNGLRKFIQEYISPSLAKLDAIKEEIINAKCRFFDAEEFIRDNYTDIVSQLRPLILLFPIEEITETLLHHYQNPTLEHVRELPKEFEVLDVRRLDSDSIVAFMHYKLFADIKCRSPRVIDPTNGKFEWQTIMRTAVLYVNFTVVINEMTKVATYDIDEDIDIEPWDFD